MVNGLKAVARREDRERAKKVTAFPCFGIEIGTPLHKEVLFSGSNGRGMSIKLEFPRGIYLFKQKNKVSHEFFLSRVHPNTQKDATDPQPRPLLTATQLKNSSTEPPHSEATSQGIWLTRA